MASLLPFIGAWAPARPQGRQLVYRGPFLLGSFVFYFSPDPSASAKSPYLRKVIF